MFGDMYLLIRMTGLRLRSSVGGNGVSRNTLTTPLLQLAKQRRFEKIEELLMSQCEDDIASWIDDCSLKGDSGLQAFKGETILHLIMVYQPPVQVIDLLVHRMSQKQPGTVPEASTDIQGKTPLSVAVAHNCDVAVIHRLMNGVASVVPAVAKDSWHRLPLHWACANPKGSSKGKKWSLVCGYRSKDSDNMTKIIEMLIKVYPHAVTIKDRNGMTPFDLAVKHDANPYVLFLLDSAWKICCKTQKIANTIDCSNSGTEETPQSDIPMEVSNSHTDDDDDDEVSSIGTGGASRYRRYSYRPAFRRSFLPYIHEQVQI